jgi:hypothetical protein
MERVQLHAAILITSFDIPGFGEQPHLARGPLPETSS